MHNRVLLSRLEVFDFFEDIDAMIGCALSGGAVASVSVESATGGVAVFSPI